PPALRGPRAPARTRRRPRRRRRRLPRGGAPHRQPPGTPPPHPPRRPPGRCLPHWFLLAGGGPQRTIAYVAESDHQQRDNLLASLHTLQAATDDAVTARIAERRQYYTDTLRELDDTPERDDDR